MLANQDTSPIILYDGECAVCNRIVVILLRIDRHKQFLFCSLQSSQGQEKLRPFGIDSQKLESLVLIYNQKAYVKSKATIQIARLLAWPWRIISILTILPTKRGDKIYDFIARNRYRIMGRQQQCTIMKPEWKQRILA